MRSKGNDPDVVAGRVLKRLDPDGGWKRCRLEGTTTLLLLDDSNDDVVVDYLDKVARSGSDVTVSGLDVAGR